MPSSPEALAQAWQPQDFAAAPPAAPPAAPLASVRPVAEPDRAGWFEVSPTSGIPDALLAPARAAAEHAGYVAGWNRGHRAAAAEAAVRAQAERRAREEHAAAARAELGQAADALRAAGRDLAGRNAVAAADIETLIVTAAFRIAESLVGAALADDERRAPAAVRRALALAPRDEPVTVRLNPADHALVADSVEIGPAVRLVADPALAPGDSTAQAGATTIDARISAGLDRVRQLLDPA